MARRRSLWRRLRRATRGPRNAVLAGALRGAGRIVAILPVPVALALGRGLGRVAHWLLRTPRRLACEHLALALPELADAERQRVVRDMFRHAGMAFVEIALWPRLRETDYVRIDPAGLRVFDEAVAVGRGVIATTGHVGNWELLAAAIAHRGYPATVVARRVNDPRFDALVADMRAAAGLRVLDRDDPRFAHALRTELADGRVVALLIDQDTRGAGIWVPFFGRPARTPAGAAVLALRARAECVAVSIERRPEGGHLIRFSRVERGEGRTRGDIEALTARMTAAIEAQIRRNPVEWVWWHRRWRRPEA
jgi:Kdo2-lipid IVA lauroyltransferase/acyltransferase